MATYKQIQDFVKSSYGFTPKSCWIAHMKELCKLPVRAAHNRYSHDKRTNPCPLEKREAIKDAFRHFNMM